jgi:hypothetical protein
MRLLIPQVYKIVAEKYNPRCTLRAKNIHPQKPRYPEELFHH